jgi:hypothetical protein
MHKNCIISGQQGCNNQADTICMQATISTAVLQVHAKVCSTNQYNSLVGVYTMMQLHKSLAFITQSMMQQLILIMHSSCPRSGY